MKPNRQVYKSNALVEARFHLTEQEQKLILIVASLIDPENPGSIRLFRVYVSDVMEILSIQGHNKYSLLRSVATGLMDKKLFIRRDNSELEMNWVASCECPKGGGYVELEFSEKLIPYLSGLRKRFTSYQLGNILRLRGQYAIRMYELLKQYESLGVRTIRVDELKRILMITNKPSYKDFGSFRTWVIEPACREINEKTDIKISFRGMKNGRRVDRVEFTIRRNKRSHSGNDERVRRAREALEGAHERNEDREFARFQDRRLKEEESKLSGSELEELERSFVESLSEDQGTVSRYFRARGFDDPMVRARYRDFRIEHLLTPHERDIESWRNRQKAPPNSGR